MPVEARNPTSRCSVEVSPRRRYRRAALPAYRASKTSAYPSGLAGPQHSSMPSVWNRWARSSRRRRTCDRHASAPIGSGGGRGRACEDEDIHRDRHVDARIAGRLGRRQAVDVVSRRAHAGEEPAGRGIRLEQVLDRRRRRRRRSPNAWSCSPTRSAFPAGTSRTAPVRRSSCRCASPGTTTTSRPFGRSTRANSAPLRGAKTLRATSTTPSRIGSGRQRSSTTPVAAGSARRLIRTASGERSARRNAQLGHRTSDGRRVVAGAAAEVGDARPPPRMPSAATAATTSAMADRRWGSRRRRRAARRGPRASPDRRRPCAAPWWQQREVALLGAVEAVPGGAAETRSSIAERSGSSSGTGAMSCRSTWDRCPNPSVVGSVVRGVRRLELALRDRRDAVLEEPARHRRHGVAGRR